MLLYIIDGFNLVHKVPELKTSDQPHIGLIRYIKTHRLTGSVTNKVTIVFDGFPRPEVLMDKTYQIIFSLERTADAVIKERIAKIKNKSQVVVVSDDREIRDCVRQEKATSLRTFDFLDRKKEKRSVEEKEISYPLQHEITEELRKIWLK
ncbi:MAG: NYN domain-containing protein [Candidatus Omnitrophota bacterium]